MGFENGASVITRGLILNINAADRNSYVNGATIWYDLVNNNNGTLINTPIFDSGNGGNITFNGLDEYVTSSLTTLPTSSSDRTFSIWFKTDRVLSTNQFHTLFSHGGSTTNAAFYVGVGGDANSPGVNPANRFVASQFGNSVGSFQTVNDNKWKNGVVVVSSSLWSLYIDGVFENSKSMSTSTTNTTYKIGYDGGVNLYFTGNISNILMYNRILSVDEILQNYNAQKSRFDK